MNNKKEANKANKYSIRIDEGEEDTKAIESFLYSHSTQLLLLLL